MTDCMKCVRTTRPQHTGWGAGLLCKGWLKTHVTSKSHTCSPCAASADNCDNHTSFPHYNMQSYGTCSTLLQQDARSFQMLCFGTNKPFVLHCLISTELHQHALQACCAACRATLSGPSYKRYSHRHSVSSCAYKTHTNMPQSLCVLHQGTITKSIKIYAQSRLATPTTTTQLGSRSVLGLAEAKLNYHLAEGTKEYSGAIRIVVIIVCKAHAQ